MIELRIYVILYYQRMSIDPIEDAGFSMARPVRYYRILILAR